MRTVEDAIAVVDLRKQVIGNGHMELWLPDGGRLDFEILIPENTDIDGTFRRMDAEIAQLRHLYSKDGTSTDHEDGMA